MKMKPLIVTVSLSALSLSACATEQNVTAEKIVEPEAVVASEAVLEVETASTLTEEVTEVTEGIVAVETVAFEEEKTSETLVEADLVDEAEVAEGDANFDAGEVVETVAEQVVDGASSAIEAVKEVAED